MMIRIFSTAIFAGILCLIAPYIQAQGEKNVLFLGNSYTTVNNLPGLVEDVALSAGDTITWNSNTPGGFTYQGHSGDNTSLNLIAAGSWDFVVLQEQSQLPSFPMSQVQNQVFPYARILDSLINLHNPCAETIFYMTWGRKNGDASNCANWPPVCTYTGMDSLLRLRYMMMAQDNKAIVSPVGALWRYLRNNFPAIELYEPDESHPSAAGSYAAACSFYSVIFRKDPTLITYNGSLSPSDASVIRNAAKAVVYDSLSYWFVGTYNPVAAFSFLVQGDSVVFTNLSAYATQYSWDFGDGQTSTLQHPVHHYNQNNTYTVSLTAIHCNESDSTSATVQVISIGLPRHQQSPAPLVYPNPAQDHCTISIPYIEARLFNAAGQYLLTCYDNEPVKLTSLKPGTYFLQIITVNGTNYAKVLLGN